MPIFYHGSYDKMEVGRVLRPRPIVHERNYGHMDCWLEMFRPPDMRARRNSVFACDNIDDIDLAGGATDYVLTLQAPDGKIERHDINHLSAIQCLESDLDGEPTINDLRAIEALAQKYWSGEPSTDPVWEYLLPEATVIAVQNYEDAVAHAEPADVELPY